MNLGPSSLLELVSLLDAGNFDTSPQPGDSSTTRAGSGTSSSLDEEVLRAKHSAVSFSTCRDVALVGSDPRGLICFVIHSGFAIPCAYIGCPLPGLVSFRLSLADACVSTLNVTCVVRFHAPRTRNPYSISNSRGSIVAGVSFQISSISVASRVPGSTYLSLS